MSWPSESARTKDWGNEILTDSDLEGQFDIVHDWLNDAFDGTSGHGHSGGDGDGSKINLTIAVEDVLPEANGGTGLSSGFLNGNPIGSLIIWPTVSAPADYLICDGSAVSRTTYASLFAILSTAFGSGDGSTTFNLPNLKGKVPVGYNPSETEFDAIGETGGEKTHTITQAELPNYNLSFTRFDGNSSGFTGVQGTTNGANPTSQNVASNGSGTAMNVLQPYITLNYCIRYQ